MTIHRMIETNNRALSEMDACAQNAPARTFERAIEAHAVVGEVMDEMIRRFREMGFNVNNSDRCREVEAVIYGWLRESDPDEFVAAEGFGYAMDTPAKERVIFQMERDRDFIEKAEKLGLCGNPA